MCSTECHLGPIVVSCCMFSLSDSITNVSHCRDVTPCAFWCTRCRYPCPCCIHALLVPLKITIFSFSRRLWWPTSGVVYQDNAGGTDPDTWIQLPVYRRQQRQLQSQQQRQQQHRRRRQLYFFIGFVVT